MPLQALSTLAGCVPKRVRFSRFFACLGSQLESTNNSWRRRAVATHSKVTWLAVSSSLQSLQQDDELSTKQVFTSELLDGIPVDQCFDLGVEDKRIIGYNIIRLCLLEILQFRYMQTDPNWANFLYNPERKQIMLLDFGASRQYSKEFMDKYVRILKAAYDTDRETIKNLSGEIGFFTGYESKVMVEAHVDAVMILGEIFQSDEPYDFANQNMTERIQHLVPTMLSHRLCPPPEEIYSLHRKLSGVFLLCSKLRVPLSCRKLFLDLYNEYVEKK